VWGWGWKAGRGGTRGWACATDRGGGGGLGGGCTFPRPRTAGHASTSWPSGHPAAAPLPPGSTWGRGVGCVATAWWGGQRGSLGKGEVRGGRGGGFVGGGGAPSGQFCAGRRMCVSGVEAGRALGSVSGPAVGVKRRPDGCQRQKRKARRGCGPRVGVGGVGWVVEYCDMGKGRPCPAPTGGRPIARNKLGAPAVQGAGATVKSRGRVARWGHVCPPTGWRRRRSNSIAPEGEGGGGASEEAGQRWRRFFGGLREHG